MCGGRNGTDRCKFLGLCASLIRNAEGSAFFFFCILSTQICI